MNTTNNIPSELFRGDGDLYGIRQLKTTIQFNQLQTNLINGGQGREINEQSLKDLINKHVGFGWQKSHFLSFTANSEIAFQYGCTNRDLTLSEIELAYTELFHESVEFNFAFITFNTNKVHWKEIEFGVYEGLFTPSLIIFSRLTPNYRIILIDVVKVLKRANLSGYEIALMNSVRDQEWLLLPATSIILNSGQKEYSAILDGAPMNFSRYSLA